MASALHALHLVLSHDPQLVYSAPRRMAGSEGDPAQAPQHEPELSFLDASDELDAFVGRLGVAMDDEPWPWGDLHDTMVNAETQYIQLNVPPADPGPADAAPDDSPGKRKAAIPIAPRAAADAKTRVRGSAVPSSRAMASALALPSESRDAHAPAQATAGLGPSAAPTAGNVAVTAFDAGEEGGEAKRMRITDGAPQSSQMHHVPLIPPPVSMVSPAVMQYHPGMMPFIQQMAHQMYATFAAAGTAPVMAGMVAQQQPGMTFHSGLQMPFGGQFNTLAGAASSGVTGPGSIVVMDEGAQHVVQQQAAARLEQHPILGRLQLQTKDKAGEKDKDKGTANPSLAERAKSEEPHFEIGTGDDSKGRGTVGAEGSNGTALVAARANTEGSPTSAVVASHSDSPTRDQKKRLVWTPELHERFMKAIEAVGLNQAVPKTLVQIMNVEGLTTEHVKSHLQKYRNSLRKEAAEEARNTNGGGASDTSRPGASSDGPDTAAFNILPVRINAYAKPLTGPASEPRRRAVSPRVSLSRDVAKHVGTAGTKAKAKSSPGSRASGATRNTTGPKAIAGAASSSGEANPDLNVVSQGAGGAGLVSLPSTGNEPAVHVTSSAASKDGAGSDVRSGVLGHVASQMQTQERLMQLQVEMQMTLNRMMEIQKQLQLRQGAADGGDKATGPGKSDAGVERTGASGGSASGTTGANAGTASLDASAERQEGDDVELESLLRDQLEVHQQMERLQAFIRELMAEQSRLRELVLPEAGRTGRPADNTMEDWKAGKTPKAPP